MQLKVIKNKFNLVDGDINNLGTWMAEGSSLEEIYFNMQNKLSIEQLFVVAEVISREMFSMPLADLCPELITERRNLSKEKHAEWSNRREKYDALKAIIKLQDDIFMCELELKSRSRVAAS